MRCRIRFFFRLGWLDTGLLPPSRPRGLAAEEAEERGDPAAAPRRAAPVIRPGTQRCGSNPRLPVNQSAVEAGGSTTLNDDVLRATTFSASKS